MLPICRVSNTHGENVYTKALTYFRMYKSKRLNLPNGNSHQRWGVCGMSKNGCYENPYIVTGDMVKTKHRLRGRT